MDQKFEDVSFITHGVDSLVNELSRPFTKLSVLYSNTPELIDKSRWASSVILWDDNKIGLKISTIMHDISSRLEVGSLSFESVIVTDQQNGYYKLPHKFSDGAIPQKLIITESGKRIESGVRITASDKAELLIVPNVMPFSLAMRCTEIELNYFEPEYSIDEYSAEFFRATHHKM